MLLHLAQSRHARPFGVEHLVDRSADAKWTRSLCGLRRLRVLGTPIENPESNGAVCERCLRSWRVRDR